MSIQRSISDSNQQSVQTRACMDGLVAGHTPGPWVVNGEFRKVTEASGRAHILYCADIVLGADDPNGWRGYIASVQSADHIGNGITREEAEANAHLLAAAPDLADALRAALCELSACANQLTDLGRNVPPNGSVNRAIIKARAALSATRKDAQR